MDYGEAIGTVQAYERAPGDHPGVEAADLCRRVVEMRPATSKALALVVLVVVLVAISRFRDRGVRDGEGMRVGAG